MINKVDRLIVRKGLPDDIRGSLLSPAKKQWKSHPNYNGMASVFVDFHSMLNLTLFSIQRQLKSILDTPQNKTMHSGALRKVSNDMQSFYAAIPRHHEVADQLSFPKFRRHFPKLSHALTLLDKDPVVLMPMVEVIYDDSYQILNTDIVSYSLLGRVYADVVKTKDLLARHLSDEEDIIIPMFLKL